MKTRAFPLLAALTLGAGVTSVASAQALKPFADPKLPFSFSYLVGWLGVDLGDKTSGVSMVSSKAPPAAMIRLLYVPKPAGAALNTTTEITNFEQGLASTGVTVKRQSSYVARYGGLSGTEREYLVSKAGKSVRMRVWFGLGSKNLYSFQVTDTPARYAAASSTFTKVMGTVRFK